MSSEKNRPNIILIVTDHFRRDAIGRSTPNLSRLANAGTQFANAYCASPLCQPSRCSIITGMYPSQHGVCGNQNDPVSDTLRDDTFMQRLRGAGYCTAMIGKHHYIDRYGIGVDVTEDDGEIMRYGFDHVCQVVDDGENLHNDDAYTKYLAASGRLEQLREACQKEAWSCGPHPFESDDSADGFIGMSGVNFVTDRDHRTPFYLNLSFIGPHPPFWHPGELTHDPAEMNAPVGVVDNERDRKLRAHYMDKCALIDMYVGRLIDALRGKGLLDNTVIVFTSDHGDNCGDYGIWDKRSYYEQSCGVPLIMSGPGISRGERMNGRRVSKALVSNIDLYPTILSIAGEHMEPDARREGANLLDVLAERPRSGHNEIHAELGTSIMVRTPNWKLAFDPQSGGVQNLFNLVTDPRELNNLAGVAGYEAVTASLLEKALARKIRLTQHTHVKEEQRLQRVHVP